MQTHPLQQRKAAPRKGQGRPSRNQSASQLLVLQQRELAEILTAGVPDRQGAEGKVSRWLGTHDPGGKRRRINGEPESGNRLGHYYTVCVTLGKWVGLLVPQFPIWNEDREDNAPRTVVRSDKEALCWRNRGDARQQRPTPYLRQRPTPQQGDLLPASQLCRNTYF